MYVYIYIYVCYIILSIHIYMCVCATVGTKDASISALRQQVRLYIERILIALMTSDRKL